MTLANFHYAFLPRSVLISLVLVETTLFGVPDINWREASINIPYVLATSCKFKRDSSRQNCRLMAAMQEFMSPLSWFIFPYEEVRIRHDTSNTGKRDSSLRIPPALITSKEIAEYRQYIVSKVSWVYIQFLIIARYTHVSSPFWNWKILILMKLYGKKVDR